MLFKLNYFTIIYFCLIFVTLFILDMYFSLNIIYLNVSCKIILFWLYFSII